jgi:hypothetical protein
MDEVLETALLQPMDADMVNEPEKAAAKHAFRISPCSSRCPIFNKRQGGLSPSL